MFIWSNFYHMLWLSTIFLIWWEFEDLVKKRLHVLFGFRPILSGQWSLWVCLVSERSPQPVENIDTTTLLDQFRGFYRTKLPGLDFNSLLWSSLHNGNFKWNILTLKTDVFNVLGHLEFMNIRQNRYISDVRVELARVLWFRF